MKCLALLLLLAVSGCGQIVSVIEYPEYLAGKERMKRLPPPALLIDPYQPTTQP